MSFFDKTGTLTQGKMTVIDTWIHDPTWTIESCNRIAASLEANSEHFIGKAISALIANKDRLTVDNFKAFPGYGIRGIIAGRLYFLGNANFLKRNNIDIPEATAADRSFPPDRQGLTEVYLAGEESCLASYFISDTLRPEATTAIENYGHRDTRSRLSPVIMKMWSGLRPLRCPSSNFSRKNCPNRRWNT